VTRTPGATVTGTARPRTPADAAPLGTLPIRSAPSPTTPARTAPRSLMQNAAGTYVADSFTGDITATMGGSPALAHDGEPAGLARITMAMRNPTRRESPAPKRLVGLSVWAAALGVLGTMLAIRAGIGVLAGAPRWYFPTASLIGVAGVGLTMGAFVTAREKTLPWILLGLSTCALIGAFTATLIAL